MSKTPHDLAWLLAPVERQSFFDVNWEKLPRYLHRPEARYYDDILTIDDLERFIASPLARYPAIQLSKGGAYFPPEAYSEDVRFGSNNFTGVPNVQKIAAEYRAGATVVLPALHRTWMPLKALCTRIESELDHVVHANAYLTPGNTAGFTPHYDTHEVLVLQIAGQKHWRIYEPSIELPHRKQPFSPTGYKLPARPLLEVDLLPGDLLYLPRGYIHTTTTSDTRSAHVTIGIAVYTWLDLAGELLQSAMTSSRFRKALPPGFATRPELLPALRQELAQVLDDIWNFADGDALINMFSRRVRATAPEIRDTFRSDFSVIAPDTRLTTPEPSDYRIVREGNKVILEFKQQRFVLPGESYDTLQSMKHMRTFRTIDLSASFDLETRLNLVRLLFDRGFLICASRA